MILKKVSFQSLAECGQRFSGRHFSRYISFQICGPTTGKARLATVDSLTDGTTIRLQSVERRHRRRQAGRQRGWADQGIVARVRARLCTSVRRSRTELALARAASEDRPTRL